MDQEIPRREETSTQQPLVISLHGIYTRGTWQKDLTAVLGEANFVHVPLDYGFYGALKILLWFARRKQAEWFRDEYTKITDTHPNRTPSIIAHSFGTYLLTSAMELFRQVKFDQIILCGSIVRRGYPWDARFAAGQVTRVLNECGRRDIVVKIATWAISDAGPSGAKGFQKAAVGSVLYERHHYDFRHSDYLYRLNYRDDWIPFLRGAEPPREELFEPNSANWKFRITLILLLVISLGFSFFLVWPLPFYNSKTSVLYDQSNACRSLNKVRIISMPGRDYPLGITVAQKLREKGCKIEGPYPPTETTVNPNAHEVRYFHLNYDIDAKLVEKYLKEELKYELRFDLTPKYISGYQNQPIGQLEIWLR